jgi:hypothetical protein
MHAWLRHVPTDTDTVWAWVRLCGRAMPCLRRMQGQLWRVWVPEVLVPRTLRDPYGHVRVAAADLCADLPTQADPVRRRLQHTDTLTQRPHTYTEAYKHTHTHTHTHTHAYTHTHIHTDTLVHAIYTNAGGGGHQAPAVRDAVLMWSRDTLLSVRMAAWRTLALWTHLPALHTVCCARKPGHTDATTHVPHMWMYACVHVCVCVSVCLCVSVCVLGGRALG